MKHLLVTIILSLCLNSEAADANALYESKDYLGAIALYQKEIKEKGPNADLYYNLGNAHYRIGNFGPAIYAYERALILDPRSPDIKVNRDLARKAAAAFDESQSQNRWISILYWLSYNEWLVTGCIALILLGAISLLRGFDFLDRSPFSLKGFVIALVIYLLLGIATLLIRHPELNRAIVINEEAKVRLSPFDTADIKASLKAGQAVHIKGQHEEFYRIENGWVSKEDVKPLIED